MSSRDSLLRGGARAVTGLFVVAVCGGALVALGSLELPSVAREPIAVTVDTTQNADQTLVCSGPFAVLGADADRPEVAIPTGEASVVVSGTPDDRAALDDDEGDGGAVLTAPVGEALGAAQAQRIDTAELRGTVAGTCAEPLNEQWLLGGESTLGVSTTLTLGNAGTVPATVQVTVFDEDGEVQSLQSAGVLVPAGSQHTLSLNGFAPDSDRVAVKVVSTGAPVTASLGVGQTEGIDPFAVSLVTRQGEATERVVIPGLSNTSDHAHGPSDAGEGDDFPVLVRAIAPDGATGTATVRAIDDEGDSAELGTIDLAGDAVGELKVATWPKDATTLVVDADVPVVASALGSATEDDEHDNEWFTAASQIPADAPTAAPVVAGGKLVIANLGEEAATVTIARADGKGKATETAVAAGASRVVTAPTGAVITSTAPVYAGVRALNGSDLAGYPILAADPREGELTVYTR